MKCASELGIQSLDMSPEEMEEFSQSIEDALGEGGLFEQLINDIDENSDDDSPQLPSFIRNMFSHSAAGGGAAPPPESESHSRKKNDPHAAEKRKRFFDTYCVSLTERARNGTLDNIIGRERETDRVIQILNRRTKNNPCLIGEPGVGKTAIAEGLAQRIVNGNVPFKLLEREVLLLDMTAMVAGTQFRGQFEGRMKNLINYVVEDGNIILVIDEVHLIIGAGDSDGAMNAANILKPALSRGEIQLIGATTVNEYRKYIEKDSALERRFQPVMVDEPSIDDAIEIVKGVAHYYEDFHGIRIDSEAVRQSVLLSERYISDRFLPDKAIDLIDEAASYLSLRSKENSRLMSIRKELEDIDREKEYLLAVDGDEKWKRMLEIQASETALSAEFDGLTRVPPPSLTTDDLANVIEQWTKIPATSIREDEYEKLCKLDERLKEHLIGQDEAVQTVCNAIRRNRVGISSKHKPVSFIFVGSTGVGKTELVKRLSSDLFNTPDALIRIDMSEFMEKHSVSRLVGSPPGYVGYDEAGQLTEKIRRRPYSVVLFDEIEKAHPDVMNLLLQILDDGHITDAHGRVVNFENTIIIMTTNAGSDRKDAAMGFNLSVTEQGKEKSMKALKEFLRPEFINRVDEVVHFNKLSEEDFVKIAEIMMRELRENMAEKNYTLVYDTSLLQYLAKKSYSQTYGARNLRRLIQKEVEDNITSVIVYNYAEPIRQLLVKAFEDKVVVENSGSGEEIEG